MAMAMAAEEKIRYKRLSELISSVCKPTANKKARRRLRSLTAKSLSDDVLTEILFRLPARSIVRLRPACKLFHSLTSDPSFIRSHAARATPAAIFVDAVHIANNGDKHQLLHYVFHDHNSSSSSNDNSRHGDDDYVDNNSNNHDDDDDDGISRVSVRRVAIGYPQDGEFGGESRLILEATCDGMLCFHKTCRCCENMSHSQRRHADRFLVCNPLIAGDWIRLLDYPHRRVPEVLAFYLHESTGEYRLLRRLVSPQDCFVHYQVLSLGRLANVTAAAATANECWRAIVDAPSFNVLCTSRGCVSVHGRLHWMSISQLRALGHMQLTIKVFDCEKEEFASDDLRTPRDLHRSFDMYLMKTGADSLGLCHGFLMEIDVYVLTDYTCQTWVKQHTISLQGIIKSIIGWPVLRWHGTLDRMRPMIAIPGMKGILLRSADPGFGMLIYDTKRNHTCCAKLAAAAAADGGGGGGTLFPVRPHLRSAKYIGQYCETLISCRKLASTKKIDHQPEEQWDVASLAM